MENPPHNWLKDGWDFFLDNYLRILPAVAAFHIIATVPTLLIWKHFDNRWYALPYETFIAAPLMVGMNLFFLNLARGRAPDYGDIFRGFSVFLRAVAVSLVYGLIVASGFIMFIIPGVIWGTMYGFAQYAVIDRRTGIKDSFVYSAVITYGFKNSLFVIFVLWALFEAFTPGVLGARGELLHPVLALDLKPWAAAATALKTFIFMPWLDATLALAYARLTSGVRPAEPAEE